MQRKNLHRESKRSRSPSGQSVNPGKCCDLIVCECICWTFLQVGWFKLDNRHLNWAGAREACTEVGAHLAVPDTQERVKVFLKLFKRHSDIPAHAVLRQQVYVGVSDPDQNRQFVTVQGKHALPP